MTSSWWNSFCNICDFSKCQNRGLCSLATHLSITLLESYWKVRFWSTPQPVILFITYKEYEEYKTQRRPKCSAQKFHTRSLKGNDMVAMSIFYAVCEINTNTVKDLNINFQMQNSKYLPLSPIQDTNSYINCRGDKRKLQAENESVSWCCEDVSRKLVLCVLCVLSAVTLTLMIRFLKEQQNPSSNEQCLWNEPKQACTPCWANPQRKHWTAAEKP